MEVVVTTGAINSCKAPVKSLPPTNQHPVVLQAGCPSCRPTNSVTALKGKYHIPWTCLPQAHLGVFQLCHWPLIAPGYLGEGCHASHQPSDAIQSLFCKKNIQEYTLSFHTSPISCLIYTKPDWHHLWKMTWNMQQHCMKQTFNLNSSSAW